MTDKAPERFRRQLAVALHYEDTDDAPRILAKGQGYVAERIIELAEQQGIPIREDADLTASLAQLDLGEAVPPELYQAVAEVLAYIYRMNMDYEKKLRHP